MVQDECDDARGQPHADETERDPPETPAASLFVLADLLDELVVELPVSLVLALQLLDPGLFRGLGWRPGPRRTPSINLSPTR